MSFIQSLVSLLCWEGIFCLITSLPGLSGMFLLLSVSLLVEAGLQSVTSHLSLETMAQLYNHIVHIFSHKKKVLTRHIFSLLCRRKVVLFFTVTLGADQYNQSSSCLIL